MKQVIITSLVIIAIIVGAIFISNSKESTETANAQGSNNWYGQEQGVITLTEYGDFQCPACAGFFPVVSQVKEQFKDQIRFEFKHFPLVQIHPNATAAHRAAQAAANQNKFWEMHDLLYENQQSWTSSTSPASIFEQYARQIELDMDKYAADVNSGEVLSIINFDVEEGKSKGANSTPTFYIDGEKIEDLSTISSIEGFTELIQEKIDAKNSSSSQN
jgi:protein-disulfide isomerase